MSNTVQYLSPIHGNYSFTLPRAEAIPVPAIQAALAEFVSAHERWKRVVADVNHAERALIDATSNDSMRMTALYERGEGDDADPREETDRAEVVLKRAEARREPAQRAAIAKARELREVIIANSEKWQKNARKKAQAARDRLAIALNTVELQRIELEESVGVLELLARDPLPAAVHVSWSVGQIEMNEAVEALGGAVVKVDEGVRAL